ncbi:nitric oxide synthase oxygenase [Paenibacillus sp. GCM10023252]|uniref:nitric oxide synthase oxygenase n=1 Tax=Paenibacillus sp. GCM10023252 TaxID=3252649 RepID=UPI0036157958
MLTEARQKEQNREADEFISLCYRELGKSVVETAERREAVAQSLTDTGYYTHTYEELCYGSKLAWRNSNRCIGRLYWQSLEVFDARRVGTEEEMAKAIFRHMAYATNGGKVRSALTVFAPEQASREKQLRIWNHQLVRYAGYREGGEDGRVIGDPASVAFTEECLKIGWRGRGTRYDVLPLVISMGGSAPRWFPIPDELVLRVPLSHPELHDFERKLQLEWYAVPFISDMMLEIGGIRYPAAPFNGWYMGTEIGARNLADTDRYDALPQVAELMGLDTSTNTSLWKDRALVELNVAVIHSYKKHGVSIVDHHTAAEQFMRFDKLEQSSGREVTGRWSWLIPPMSPAASPIWHRSYADVEKKPCFSYQEAAYKLPK